jgi:hypothetical protein
VWCAVYSHGIIGPYFFENEEERIQSLCVQNGTVMLETFLRSELHPRQQDLLWFQQDVATAHTAEISMQVLRTLFPDRLVTCFEDITWPARSPDLVISDNFLWGYVRNKVYETCSANIADLKQRILDCIEKIPKSMFQRVMTAFPSRPQECIEQHGGHY